MTTPYLRIALAVVERDGEVLIGQRPPGVPLAGLWEFPGGKVKTGELYEAAAVRECMEEAGLAVTIVEELPAATHEYDHATVAIRCFRCAVEEQQLSNKPQGSFRWVRKSALAKYEFPKANQALLQALLATEQSQSDERS